MAGFEFFISQCGGEATLAGLTTDEICRLFLLPLTDKDKCSYCDLLSKTNDEFVGPANIFVSHAWRGEFLEVVAAIRTFVSPRKAESDFILWFDLFSNNQHIAVFKPFEWWQTTFRSAIAHFGHTLLVMAPWRRPVALSRAWCLFEIYSTVITGSLLHVAIIPSELITFRHDICCNYDLFYKFLASVDLRHSEATQATDRDRIFEVVERTSSFNTLNEKVISHLRFWMRTYLQTTIDSELAAGCDPFNCHRDRNALAVMLKTQGMYAEALAVWELQLAAALQSKGAESVEALGAQNKYAM